MLHANSSFLVILLLLLSNPCLGDEEDTISITKTLKDPQILVSKNGTFNLGFFSSNPSSTHRYLGIWYGRVSKKTIIWVANRNKPMNDSSGVLKISDDGNYLQLLHGSKNGTVIWSSSGSKLLQHVGMEKEMKSFSRAQILDSGNFIFLQYYRRRSSVPRIVWQSFDHPTDSFLPAMRLPSSTIDKEEMVLRSWRTPWDPSDGTFSISLGTTSLPQVFLWENGAVSWRGGPWDGIGYIGIDVKYDSFINNGFSVQYNSKSETTETSFSPENMSIMMHYTLDSQGTLNHYYWNETSQNWSILWSAPAKECDSYSLCGPFGSCNPGIRSPVCKCLPGFEPKNNTAWKKGIWSNGCIRGKPLQCGGDGFLMMKAMKPPNVIEKQVAINQEGCRAKCLSNCSCVAYAYHTSVGCMTWSQDLLDTQQFSNVGVDLFLRLAASELNEGEPHKKTAIIASVAVIGGVALAMFACFMWRWMGQRGKRVQVLNEPTFRNANIDQVELQAPPLFTLQMLKKATNNFQDTNKLGEGGFGTVYKGTLEDRKEVAVKKLSHASEKGEAEFMNEVAIMSELQYKNLVRLLGCCVTREEKMLVFEYMPNKSLDKFLFDPQNRELLSWTKRRNIIEGICRGLVYLHRDSRKKIIHRDLSASNILLDKDLNPKISDFGTARIFGENQSRANTRSVVGTYGYMSPEYTMGQFSEKSDVYSFGVLLLEIVSGRSNTSFRPMEHSCTLLGYVWSMWNEGKIVSFVDEVISEPCFQAEVLRCIHVGLLCVQKNSRDRPNISILLSMLDIKMQLHNYPEKPPFTEWEVSTDSHHGNNTTIDFLSIVPTMPTE